MSRAHLSVFRIFYLLIFSFCCCLVTQAQMRAKPKGDSYTYIIYIDQPVAGQNVAYRIVSLFPFDVDVGHTWWELKTSSKDKLSSELQAVVNQPVGYYPLGGVSPASPSAQGRFVMPDTGHEVDVKREYKLTEDELRKGLEFTRALQLSPGTYNLDSNNCTDAAIAAGRAAGQNIPGAHGTWPGGGGNNPGTLGELLR